MAKIMSDMGVHNVEAGIRVAERNIEHLKRQIINGLDARPQDIWVDALLKSLTDLAREQVLLKRMTDIRDWMYQDADEMGA